MASDGHLFACIVCVWLSWSAHDYLQEKMFRIPGFKFGFFMAFVLQATSSLLAALHSGVVHCCGGSASRDDAESDNEIDASDKRIADAEAARLKEDQDDKNDFDDDFPSVSKLKVPEGRAEARVSSSWRVIGWYVVLAALLAGSNGCASAALNYVSMPVKVLFKSSKIVTVMLLGSCFGKLYKPAEYLYMALVVLGLVAFFVAGASRLKSSVTGIGLLVAAVMYDSLVPNVQYMLLQTRSKSEMVFHTNWMSAALTLCYIGFTGELSAAIGFMAHRPRACSLLLLQSCCGYCGIVCYLETVRCFGSKATTIITSCRKIFTIALSSLVFGHLVNGYHVAGIGGVFAGVLLNANAELRCSRLVAAPVLVALLLVCASQLVGMSPQHPTGGTPAHGVAALQTWEDIIFPPGREVDMLSKGSKGPLAAVRALLLRRLV